MSAVKGKMEPGSCLYCCAPNVHQDLMPSTDHCAIPKMNWLADDHKLTIGMAIPIEGRVE